MFRNYTDARRVSHREFCLFCPILLQVKKAQIALGDREVYINEEGERMSRLKVVNSDWIIRRLERWGKRVFSLLRSFLAQIYL